MKATPPSPAEIPPDPEPSRDGSPGAAAWLRRIWVPSLAVPLALALGIRLLLLPWFSDPYNFYGSYVATDILRQGLDPLQLFSADPVFGELNPWGYPGLYFSVTLAAQAVSLGDPLLYGVWLRVPSVLLDGGTALLLFHIARRVGASEAASWLVSVAFLFNPFSILVTSVWGVNDPLPVFFTVLGVHLLLRNHGRDLDLASLSLGVGVALKLYPLLLVPLVLARAEGAWSKVRTIVLVGAVPALSSLPFLLTSGSTYLGVLLGFASGAEEGGLDPQRSILSALGWLVGPLDPRLALVPVAALILVLAWIYWRARIGRLHPILGASIALMATALLTVRWIPNYALWAVPFATMQALLFTGGRWRWVPMTFWAPAMVDAGIHMGWYADPHSGASGLPYWALVANGPAVKVVELVPPATLAILGGLFVAASAGTLYLALRAGGRGEVPARSQRPSRHGPSPGVPRRLLPTAVLLVLVAGTVASAYVQVQQRGAVTPADFASFAPAPDGAIRVHDDFHARFLSFRWAFRGNGTYALHPNGTSGILLDTGRASGSAYLEDPLSSALVQVDITFRVNRKYGMAPLLLASGPGGWLEITGPPNAPSLAYFDELGDEHLDLGSVGSGWLAASLRFTPDRREVRALGTTLVLDGAGPVEGVHLGHDRPVSGGGGILEISTADLMWTLDTAAPRGPPLWAVAVSGVLATAALFLAILATPRVSRRASGSD